MKNILKYTALFLLLLPTVASADGVGEGTPTSDCTGPLHYYGYPSDISFDGKVSAQATAGFLGASGATSGTPTPPPPKSIPIDLHKPVVDCGIIVGKSWGVGDIASSDSNNCGWAKATTGNRLALGLAANESKIHIDLTTSFRATGNAQISQQCCSTGAPIIASVGSSAPKSGNSFDGFVTFFIPTGKKVRLRIETELQCALDSNVQASASLKVALKKMDANGQFVLHHYHWWDGVVDQDLEVVSNSDENTDGDSDSITADAGIYRLECTYSTSCTSEETISCSSSNPLDEILNVDITHDILANVRLDVVE